jgi:hypothetical protein
MSNLQANQRLSDRLASARRRYFVGRNSELELFRAALAAPELPFAVLHLYGPGGVGKTTLLYEYRRRAQETGILSAYVDGRNVDPSPPGFIAAFNAAIETEGRPVTIQDLPHVGRIVLLIDTYENLTPLDDWLREEFLPQLPQTCLTVIAGRNPPEPAWRTTPGWRDLTQIVALRNLHPEESRSYLQQRNIPHHQHSAALQFTHGHPLALSLVADVMTQEGSPFQPEAEPDVVRLLLEHFIQHVPSPEHRQALEVCAHVRVTTEALLAAALEIEDAYDLFYWLNRLSFIEQSYEGVFPHDLAREVIDMNLRWRNPDYYRQLHQRVRQFLVQRFQITTGTEQQRAFFDIMYLHRNNPVMKRYVEWKAMGQAFAEPAMPADFPAILSMVQKHEGEASRQIAAYWLQRQPEAFLSVRDMHGVLIGFMAHIALHAATAEDTEHDPALLPALNYMQRYGPVRAGEEVVYHRFAMANDTYQQVSPVFNLVSMSCAQYWLTHPKLSWCFLRVADADYWEPQLTYSNLWRSPEADFEVGERPYAVFTHDWRVEPAAVWLEITGARELAADFTVEMAATTRPKPLIVLSQPEFEEAVRTALRDYTRSDLLADNPLMRSRLLADQAGREVSADALQALIREAAETVRANPKGQKFYRAIYHTYLQPAATQERAAELLDLPFGTYRYHLSGGIERITKWLWQRELYGF